MAAYEGFRQRDNSVEERLLYMTFVWCDAGFGSELSQSK